MAEKVLDSTSLFRFMIPCKETKSKWTAKGIELGSEHIVPCFKELDDEKVFGEVRLGWSAAGVFLNVEVKGKKIATWCRQTKLQDSDGIHLWFDTRNTLTVHRASKFCHRFFMMPTGAGSTQKEPYSTMVKINRAREESGSFNRGKIQLKSKINKDGYTMRAFIPAEALFGFDPSEHLRMSFCYAIHDSELGWQSLAMGPEFPIAEDPSLWSTVEFAS